MNDIGDCEKSSERGLTTLFSIVSFNDFKVSMIYPFCSIIIQQEYLKRD